MFRIGDFSKITQVSVRMLRYYESKGILIPIRIDEDSKYRWYSVTQMQAVNKIKALRDMGFLVEEIKQILMLNETEFSKIIQKQKQQLQQDIIKQQNMLSKLELLEQRMLQQENSNLEYEVQIKQIPKIYIMSYRQKIKNYNEEGSLWKRLDSYVKAHKILVKGNVAIFHDGEDIDVEVCYEVSKPQEIEPPFYYRALPEEKEVASIMVYGSFENIGSRYQDIAHWIDTNGYEISGNVREIPINGPWNREDENEYWLSEITWGEQ
jgi:DNA-binding transcriptional MerR regulator